MCVLRHLKDPAMTDPNSPLTQAYTTASRYAATLETTAAQAHNY